MNLKTWLFRCVAIGLSLSLLGAFELLLRKFQPELAESVDRFRLDIQNNENRRFSAIKEPDPVLLWKLKPNSPISDTEQLNSYGFRGDDFTGPKPPGTYRILILGDSRSFGFGMMDRMEIYPEKIRGAFNSETEGTRVQVINLSVIGYSSYQGRMLYETFGRSLDPDVVVIWFGFNDMLFYHTTDEAASRTSPFWVSAHRFAGRLYTYHWLTSFRNRINQPGKPVIMRQTITERVPPGQYERNLDLLTESIRSSGAKPIMMTSPIRPNIPVVMNAKVRNLQKEDGISGIELVTQYDIGGYWLMDRTEFPGTETDLDALLIDNPDIAILHYYKGIFLRNRGDFETAGVKFAEAERLDDTRKTVEVYNRVTAKVAKESGAAYIDLVPLFQDFSRYPLFIDDCHPNANGHGLVAGAILRQLTGVSPDVIESKNDFREISSLKTVAPACGKW